MNKSSNTEGQPGNRNEECKSTSRRSHYGKIFMHVRNWETCRVWEGGAGRGGRGRQGLDTEPQDPEHLRCAILN